jgi:hypothetical protein
VPAVYVAAPIGERTAGPEAATQFVDAVRRRGVEAYLIPMRNHRGRRNDPEYDIYDFQVADRIRNPNDAILVIAEISPIESRRELQQVPRNRTWLGWFSVTNCPDPRARYFRPSEECCSTYPPGFVPDQTPVPADFELGTPIATGPFRTWREARRRSPGWAPTSLSSAVIDTVSMHYARRIIDDPEISFFAQSFFAQGFVRQVLGKQAQVITDPIRRMEIPRLHRKTNVVAYNHVKSWSMIEQVARHLPDVEFVAIKDMSFDQVIETLATATMYLELGHLPGRDRMTREASFLGTPVVVLARGSGYCWADFPLPVEYRIPFRAGWPTVAAAAIQGVLADPNSAARAQQDYRNWVIEEPERYEAAIDTWLAAALR